MSGAHDYKFDLSIFEPTQDFTSHYDGPVVMNGMTLLARQVKVSPSHVYAIIEGERYWYFMRATPSEVRIAVRRSTGVLVELCSIMWPTNQSELLEAISTIATDHEPVLDAAEMAPA